MHSRRQTRAWILSSVTVAGLAALTHAQPGVTDAMLARKKGFADQQVAAPHIAIAIDRDAASRLGLSASMIDNTLYDAFGQRQIATIYTATTQYKVVLEVQAQFRNDPAALSKIYVPTP